MPYNILLVDDDASQIKVVETIVKDRMKCNTKIVSNGQQAIDILTANESDEFDLVLLDLSMPGIDGIGVLDAVKPVKPDLPIIVRTGFDDVELAIKAMKAGATDFVKKLDEPERLQTSISNALRIHALNDELSRLKRSINRNSSFDDIIGNSPLKRDMERLGKKVAGSAIPVLIEGESGVGKEMLARAIHNESDRKDKPFIAVNCGAIPENLVESALFGHEKGSFTGALYKTYGKFREAEGGTLFLDEVGELKPDIQVKLLRALQDGEIEPVGASKSIKVNVRIISATNKNLAEAIKAGTFREDLFYRLNVFPIYVPSLKERKPDIKPMIEYFYKTFSEAENKHITSISKEAENLLINYEWQGNIRQLKNAIFRAVVLCEDDILKSEDFPQLKTIPSENVNKHSYHYNNFSIFNDNGKIKPLTEIESGVITVALELYKNKITDVAKALGLSRSTLYRKMADIDTIEKYNNEHINNTP